MAAPTQTITGLVVRRTKLGESDAIITLLAQDGSQYKAVAKGARKPTSTFASRLELYAVATLLIAKGRNLDIVKEVRLVEGHAHLRCDFIRSSAAAPLVELLAKATFQDQPTPRLFDLACSALATIERTQNDPLSIALAGLLKALAFLGFRPIFQECVGCGSPLDLSAHAQCAFSYFDGGVVCQRCMHEHETTPLDASMLRWANALLFSTFDEVASFDMPASVIRDMFVFVGEWIRVHLGIGLRSIPFLFKNVCALS